MNIKEMTETELKALAFDELTKAQIAQNNVAAVTQELSLRAKKTIEDKDNGNETPKNG